MQSQDFHHSHFELKGPRIEDFIKGRENVEPSIQSLVLSLVREIDRQLETLSVPRVRVGLKGLPAHYLEGNGETISDIVIRLEKTLEGKDKDSNLLGIIQEYQDYFLEQDMAGRVSPAQLDLFCTLLIEFRRAVLVNWAREKTEKFAEQYQDELTAASRELMAMQESEEDFDLHINDLFPHLSSHGCVKPYHEYLTQQASALPVIVDEQMDELNKETRRVRQSIILLLKSSKIGFNRETLVEDNDTLLECYMTEASKHIERLNSLESIEGTQFPLQLQRCAIVASLKFCLQKLQLFYAREVGESNSLTREKKGEFCSLLAGFIDEIQRLKIAEMEYYKSISV